MIPYADYQRLLERLEDAEELRAYARAKAELSAGDNESIPAVVVDRLSAGESPLRASGERRGLIQQALADATGLGKSFVSQLESGTKTGTIGTLRALPQALQVDLDDLTPWPQDR
mgnify:CR=1 FL=1